MVFIFSRFHFLTEEQASGIGVFVGKFALPAIIFGSLCKIDLTKMNWSLWLSILLSKMIVFVAVLVIHRLASRSKSIGISSLYGIFVTQSNDFALGLPILNALFEASDHPEYPSYLFLLAPIQLAIINPIALVLIEISQTKEDPPKKYNTDVPKDPEIDNVGMRESNASNSTKTDHKDMEGKTVYADEDILLNVNHETSTLTKMANIALGLILNPIILMTIAGLFFGSVVFKGKYPIALDKLVGTIGNSFSSLALFTLGMAMVGTMEGFKDKNKLFIAVILVIVKTILLPVVAYGVTLVLCSGENEAQKQDLAGFAFLVGALPTAPTAYVFASKYNINPDMIAGAMVACTIISAPLIYGSGNYDCKFCPLYIQLIILYVHNFSCSI